MSETQQNLFTVLERGDRKIGKIKKKIIALVGLTRAGKSCTYNWILGRNMIGKGNKIQANYVTLIKDEEMAVINDGFTSVTLIPNSYDLDEETTLIDLAGFFDARNYVGVMGVSYFLKSTFEKAEEVKFLVVVTQNVFADVNGVGWTKTLQGFLNMFKPEALTPEVKNKIFSSVSLVVTRAKNPHEHEDYLQMIAQNLRHPEFKIQKKELINEMMDRIISDHRIFAFKMAQPNTNPESCKMLEHLNKMDWQFLKLREIEKDIGIDLINIPFKDDVKSLPAIETEALTKAIDEHISSYSDFTLILKQLMVVFKNHWLNFVENNKNGAFNEDFMDEILNFQTVFKRIQIFLKKSDKYKSDQLINQDLKITYTRPNLVQAIKSMLKIYTVADTIGAQEGTFQENMKKYTELFSQLAHCITPFCVNSQQERLILRMVFILRRGFHEFGKFYEIDDSKIHTVNQKMKDECNFNIYEESNNQYLAHFIKNMNIDILTQLFKTIPEVQEYEELYQYYKTNFPFNQLCAEKTNQIDAEFNEQNINISFVKSDLFVKQNDKAGAICSFTDLLHRLCEQGNLIINTSISSSNANSEHKLNQIYLMKLKIIEKLVAILITLERKQYPTVKNLAISLCVHANEINMACEVYEAQLKDFADEKIKSCEILQNYANYCILWGRYEKAKVLLQRKLQLQNYNIEERSKTITCLSTLTKDQMRLLSQEQTHIQKLMNRLPQNDSELQDLLKDIQNAVK